MKEGRRKRGWKDRLAEPMESDELSLSNDPQIQYL